MTRPIRSVHDIKGVSLDIPEPIRIDAPDPLCVHYLEGNGTRLVVSFAGVGTRRHGPQPPEFLGAASGSGENHVLFISDTSRSWMNTPGLAASIVSLVEQFRQFHAITEVVAVGNSMGAFSALVLADLMPIATVVAIAPQYSMHPDLMPEETRWVYHRNKIENWIFPDVGALDRPDTAYFILHGGHDYERRHWRRFPDRKFQLVFKGMPHDIAGRMRKRRVLEPVLAAAIAQKPRKLRKLLQAKRFGRKFDVMWREDFEAEFPEAPAITAAPSGGSAEATT